LENGRAGRKTDRNETAPFFSLHHNRRIESRCVGGRDLQVRSSSSTIGFAVIQFLGTTQGKFTRFSGKIDVDREHPENSSVTAQIDVRSIDTRIKKRDDHLRSPGFFNVERFPR